VAKSERDFWVEMTSTNTWSMAGCFSAARCTWQSMWSRDIYAANALQGPRRPCISGCTLPTASVRSFGVYWTLRRSAGLGCCGPGAGYIALHCRSGLLVGFWLHLYRAWGTEELSLWYSERSPLPPRSPPNASVQRQERDAKDAVVVVLDEVPRWPCARLRCLTPVAAALFMWRFPV
jgi:hypothetical protein